MDRVVERGCFLPMGIVMRMNTLREAEGFEERRKLTKRALILYVADDR